LAEPRIPRIARQERAAVDFPIRGGERHLATTNPLLQQGYEGTIGLKTGYTEEAGPCLAAVVRRDGRTLVAILLDSPDPAAQAEKLLEAGFAQGRPEAETTQGRPGSGVSPPPSRERPPADPAARARRGST
jgi:D-alanyl-D-alanine carboxypeptidase